MKPKPRYIKPSATSSTLSSSSRPQSAVLAAGGDVSFDSTTIIRTAIFDEWKVQAQKRMKQIQLEKKKMEEMEEKKRRVNKFKIIKLNEINKIK